MSEIRINRSRIRDPYVRFCERDEVSILIHLTLLDIEIVFMVLSIFS